MLHRRRSKSRKIVNVCVGLTDVWSKPGIHFERNTQALWGTQVEVLGTNHNGFVKGALPDKSKGFLRSSHLGPAPHGEKADIRISSNFVPVRSAPAMDADIIFGAHFNTEFIQSKTVMGWTEVVLLDHSTGWIPDDSFLRIEKENRERRLLLEIINKAKEFIGTPYLWGGITPAGWDCSGFIQAILRHFDILFPRDTKDQVKCGRRIRYISHRPGDLIFFDRHVGMVISENRIIHCSAHRGSVGIDTLENDGGDYGRTMFNNIRAVKRIFPDR